jgi:hypothetical protein
MWLLAIVGCGSDCPPGYTLDANGQCHGSGGDVAQAAGDGNLEWSEVLDSFPACEGLTPGDELDLAAGCADGGCVGMTLSELAAAWGTATCDDVYCAWDDYDVGFDDDPQGGGTAEYISLNEGYGGADANGLGVGATVSCFSDVFGVPDAMYIIDAGTELGVFALDWDDPDFEVYDFDANDLPDWRVDQLVLSDD